MRTQLWLAVGSSRRAFALGAAASLAALTLGACGGMDNPGTTGVTVGTGGGSSGEGGGNGGGGTTNPPGLGGSPGEWCGGAIRIGRRA